MYFCVVITVNIVGSGNVAWHLATQLVRSTQVELQQWASRNNDVSALFSALQSYHTSLEKLRPAQLTILAVSDTAIAGVSTALPYTDQLVVHTSGSTAMEVLDNKNKKGVFYPLQTFTKGIALDFTVIPICLEAQDEISYTTLKTVASALSEKIHTITTTQRKQLHLAAVFANNFTNHCYTVAQEICEKHELPFELLHELIKETTHKALHTTPNQSQTGPAKRGDTTTLEKQKETLDSAAYQELYTALSKAITTYYGKKL